MREFKPTFLCIKQHSITGLLYFCKTTKKYDKMFKYPGSGKYWKNHLKKHGRQTETIWYCLYYDKKEIEEFALMCSEQWNIVKAKDSMTGLKIWANEIPENGLGGSRGNNGANKGKKYGSQTMDHRANTSKALKGLKKPKRSAEHTKNQSLSHKDQIPWNKGKSGLTRKYIKIICPHCSKVGHPGPLKRYHFDNCKHKEK